MFKKYSFVPGSDRKHTWLIALLCVIVLGASACQISPSNSLTSTPTRTPTPTATLDPEDYEPDEEATETATQAASTAAPLTAVSGSEDGGPGDPVNVCPLISQEEAEIVLGQAVTRTTPGVDMDDTSGQTLNYCTYLGQGLAVVLSVVDTGSLVSAAATINQELANMQSEDEFVSASQVTGLGDQAYWTIATHAAGYTVQTGTIVFTVVLGGNIGDPADHQEALLGLASSVAGRI